MPWSSRGWDGLEEGCEWNILKFFRTFDSKLWSFSPLYLLFFNVIFLFVCKNIEYFLAFSHLNRIESQCIVMGYLGWEHSDSSPSISDFGPVSFTQLNLSHSCFIYIKHCRKRFYVYNKEIWHILRLLSKFLIFFVRKGIWLLQNFQIFYISTCTSLLMLVTVIKISASIYFLGMQWFPYSKMECISICKNIHYG